MRRHATMADLRISRAVITRRRLAIDVCHVLIDGTDVSALAGQTVAAVLVSRGTWRFRSNPVSGDPRGPYCGMGICFECELEVDGVANVRACMTPVREGMSIRTEAYRGADAG